MDGLRRVFFPESPCSESKIPRLSEPDVSNEEDCSTSGARIIRPTYDKSSPDDDGNVTSLDLHLNTEKHNKENETTQLALSQLPEDALLHVFSFLEQNDRLRVSAVCRPWRRLVLSCPRLWRRRQLTLRCSRHSSDSRRACFYVRRLGRHLRKLTVSCEHPENHACRSMAICFRKLLASLKTPTALTSFKVTELRLLHTRAQVILNISIILDRLIRSLKRLKSFQMSNAHWPTEEGLRVIRSVLAVSGESLHTLRIDGFFIPGFVPTQTTDVLTAGLGSLSCLTKLSIDYFYLNEETVLTLASTRRGQLRSLKLVACHISPHSRFISKFAWQALTNACPALRVEFCVQGFTVSPARSLPLLLCPSLRVNKIKLSIGGQYTYLDMPRLNMAAVLGHVTRYFRRRLIRFEMDIDNHNDSLDAALIRLVRKSRNLVSVKVTAYFNNPDTDVVVRELVRARRDKPTTETDAHGGGGEGSSRGENGRGGDVIFGEEQRDDGENGERRTEGDDEEERRGGVPETSRPRTSEVVRDRDGSHSARGGGGSNSGEVVFVAGGMLQGHRGRDSNDTGEELNYRSDDFSGGLNTSSANSSSSSVDSSAESSLNGSVPEPVRHNAGHVGMTTRGHVQQQQSMAGEASTSRNVDGFTLGLGGGSVDRETLSLPGPSREGLGMM